MTSTALFDRRQAFARSESARSYEEHVAAAEELVGMLRADAAYVGTPVQVEMAQVHATLALAIATREADPKRERVVA